MSKKKHDENLFDRIHGSLLAAACGDALGAPVETMTPEEILSATGGKGVTRYENALQTKISDTMTLPKGSTTDDTQLTLAVADSLIRRGGFNLADQARALVEARFGTSEPVALRRLLPEYAVSGTVVNRSHRSSWQGTGMRWGSTTEKAVHELAQRIAYGDSKGRHHEQVVAFEKGAGGGNGPAMKVAPLAIAYPPVRWSQQTNQVTTCREEVFPAFAFQLARQTHGDIIPAHGSIAIGTAVATMLAVPQDASISLVKDELVRWTTNNVNARELLDRYIPCLAHARKEGGMISTKMATAYATAPVSVSALRKAVGAGFLTIQSVPFALGIAYRNGGDIETALIEAVNAGGDADTNASMVGAIVGARIGASRIPSHLVDGLPKAVRFDITQAASELYHLHKKFLRYAQ